MPPNGPPPAPSFGPPTRVRYSVLGLLCLLAMITYMDRAMYGSAKGDLMAAVGRDVTDFYLVTIGFQLAYALFEIPTGWLGDRFGPRSTLLRIVLWWSAFVALTGAAELIFQRGEWGAVGFGLFLFMQFCFGAGEAGAFPNIAKSIYNWFPLAQRGFAQGAIWLSARFMGGLTPAVWVLLTLYAGLTWQQNLWLFAGAAVVWCLLFAFWFRNRPDEHPAANAAERELILAGKSGGGGHDGVPWGAIFGSRNVWSLCLMYMVTNFNWYFLLYNLPGMLKEQFPHLGKTPADQLTLAVVGGAPLLVGMFGCLIGGLLTDRHLRRTGDRVWARRTYGMLGYGLAGVAYLLAALTLDGGAPFGVFAACAVAVGFCNDLIMGPSWATAQDIGRRYSAIVSGAMNMIGNLGAVLGLLVSGLILKGYSVAEPLADGGTRTVIQPAGYVTCFFLYAAIYAAGVGVWLLIDPTKPVVTDREEPAHG
ncbi:MAG: MFS transporter [Gemmataceae bacterium]|nr:MFS transporter [Gemmataceae bacterium]